MYGGQASLGRACADLFQQARLNTDCKINFPGWVGVGVVGKAENIATQPSLAGAWADLGNNLMNETRNFHVTDGPLFSEHVVKKIVMDNK